MEKIDEWLAWRTREDERLYTLYGKPLEEKHTGELVAIGPGGDILLGGDEVELMKRASERFGPGNYAFRGVGFDLVYRIRYLPK